MSEASEQGGPPQPADRTIADAGTTKPPAAEKPRIGDTRPAPSGPASADSTGPGSRRRTPRQRSGGAESSDPTEGVPGKAVAKAAPSGSGSGDANRPKRKRRRNRPRAEGSRSTSQGGDRSGGGRGTGGRSNGGRSESEVVEHVVAQGPIELDESQLESRRGRVRKGRPVGRYVMVVSKRPEATHIAILEGRNLIEYYVSRASDDVFQIHGNIYVGRVQNVLPGMEAAFVDIATPKNAVLYRGDVLYDKSDFDASGGGPKIEQILKPKQNVLCQVTKNPIAHKGARLTTEVSLPGRFVVLVPNSDTYGISKRLPDPERKRLRKILDKARPKEHGIIVRTAAENVTAEEIERDVEGLLQQWRQIDELAKKTSSPALLYREPEMSVRVIREEFNKEYRAVIIDDRSLYDEVSSYVSVITPALADRVEFYDAAEEGLPVFERYHVHEQLHKALDSKVWLPSGGSLIIEHTEALTVIDVNTGKNVGSSSLEETVFRNNLEAAEEVAHQLRLRDIGGIIVIDFVDMEDKKHRDEVTRVFRAALARDKTRTQVFDIGELGLAEMTRKRIGEGLLESLSSRCPHCEGRGHLLADDIG